MKPKYDVQVLVKVAQMYYIYGYKQSEIAGEMKISRSLVSILLTKAKEMGIVEVKYAIKNPLLNHDELSKEFNSYFDIKKCIIIPSSINEPEIATKLVAERAAEVFNEDIHNDSVIGIAWGTTCYEFMLSYVPIRNAANINVIPLVGCNDKTSLKYQLNEMVRIFAQKINGTPTFIYAPSSPDSIEDKKLYLKSSQMKSLTAKWHNVDIAVISVGAPPECSHIKDEDINTETLSMFEMDCTKPVGDICARHFNINGEFIKDEYYDRIIGISDGDLKKAKNVICAAAGVNKAFSIIGALRTGIINTFICDEQTARLALKVIKMNTSRASEVV